MAEWPEENVPSFWEALLDSDKYGIPRLVLKMPLEEFSRHPLGGHRVAEAVQEYVQMVIHASCATTLISRCA